MAWKAIDRIAPVVEKDTPSLLSEAVRGKIRSFFDRYAQKRAALLPSLHVVQHALGHVPWQAMVEIADLLEIHPTAVIDTISFYTHFWTHPKGEKVVTVCRSISCELMGGHAVLEEIKRHLKIGIHETTPDGKYSLAVEECLAGCDHAPCLIVNEKLHKRVRPGDVAKLLDDPNNDRINVPRSDLFDGPRDSESTSATGGNGKATSEEVELGTTSDVREMHESG